MLLLPRVVVLKVALSSVLLSFLILRWRFFWRASCYRKHGGQAYTFTLPT